MTTAYMPRQKRPTTARSIRLIDEIASAVDNFADDQLISSNAAVNKLLRDRLSELGYISDDKHSKHFQEQSWKMPAASVQTPKPKKKWTKTTLCPIHAAKFEIEEIILYISQFEEKSSEIDQNLEKRLSVLAKKITEAIYIE